ncbi:hypothetical protein [Dyella lutea]|uniref:Uncharacterized protein n=1 Tax=Dyella lutea TaxID=2950441 RepID=A0ABT1FIT4_9GAMM|nr:hypothetical protein [Dyella lutea]MCP1376038.1 hypothetical protein [Dyella lutea]
MRSKLVAPFAHLLGFRASEDDDDTRMAEDDKQCDGESDEDYAKRMEEKDKAKKAKKAEDGQDGDDESDDSDEEMRGSSAAAQARQRERARCKAIFSCAGAGVRPDVAATLAFNTSMSRKEAIAVLNSTAAVHTGVLATTTTEAAGATSRGNLDRRMASLKVPQAGADAGPEAPAGMSEVAQAIVAAGEKARGK